MHTKSAPQPYSRKGFGICIQCIQRIPTPFVFVFSLLLGREYMNTVNTIDREPVLDVQPNTRCRRPIGLLRRPRRTRPEARLRVPILYSGAFVNTSRDRT